MTLYLGLDIGGTKTVVASAREDGIILKRLENPTPKVLEEGLGQLDNMIEQVVGNESVEAIGAAVGGPLDYETGIISPLHQPNWRDFPFKHRMEKHWGVPCSVEVDTNAAALGEYTYANDSPSRLFYLTVSTGIGGGLLINGEIYRGAGGMHTEVGHQSIAYRYSGERDLVCECGAAHCLTALASGSGIRRNYGVNPVELSEPQWAEVAYNLGQGLRNLATIFVPDVIVLGGGVAFGGGERILQASEAVMRENVQLVPVPELRLSRLGQETPLMGAITLAIMATP